MKIFGVAMASAAMLALVVVLATTGISVAQSDDPAPVAPSDLTVALSDDASAISLTWTPGQNLPEGYSQVIDYCHKSSKGPADWITALSLKGRR